MKPHRAVGLFTAIVLAALVATWLSPLQQVPPGTLDGSLLPLFIPVR